jgi:ketosteroid isomerase-like protein
MATDTAALLQQIYAAWGEQRLDDVIKHLDENFLFVVHLPEDLTPASPDPRGREETLALLLRIKDVFDVLFYDHGPIIIAGGRAMVQPVVRYRHKASGEIIETKLSHAWQFVDDRAITLEERYDRAAAESLLRNLQGRI